MENQNKITVRRKLAFLFLALSFLTRIPVKSDSVDESDWKWSGAAFPLCGYILGAIALLPYALLCFLSKYFNSGSIIPPGGTSSAINILGAFFYIALLAWMTRIFHLDGFCDTCDAFAAMNASEETRLKIMKDPHPGAAGVSGLILLLIGKVIVTYLLLEYLSSKNEILLLFTVLVAVPAIARFTMLYLAAISRYPRESGTAAIFVGKVPAGTVITALITLSPAALIIPWQNLLLPTLFSVLVLLYWKTKSKQLLGGVTGDILGACCETAEIAVAFGFLLSGIKIFLPI